MSPAAWAVRNFGTHLPAVGHVATQLCAVVNGGDQETIERGEQDQWQQHEYYGRHVAHDGHVRLVPAQLGGDGLQEDFLLLLSTTTT